MNGGKVDVILHHNFPHIPSCQHGPCLLFERFKQSGSTQFFACSVYRNKKDCQFYLDASSSKLKFKEPPALPTKQSYIQQIKILKQMKALPAECRAYCHECSCLFDGADKAVHRGHEVLSGLDDALFKRPSTIIKPILDAEKESQYWFSSTTTEFLVRSIKDMKIDSVLCIGAPRLFEQLRKSKKTIKSFLLDFDSRFESFYTKKQFARYNMFVHHFFTGQGEEEFASFLETSPNLLIFVDPPFGAMIAPLLNTLKKIQELHKSVPQNTKCETMLIYPYFMEKTVQNYESSLKMLDYMVEYENHPEYKLSKCKQGSPVRIYTTIDSASVKLPPIGYRFCKKCSRYVYNRNQHCKLCKACTSKDGRTYVHCISCSRCVKPTYEHCFKCKQCHKRLQKCPESGKCHICQAAGHKRNECPKRKLTNTLQTQQPDRKKSKKGDTLKEELP